MQFRPGGSLTFSYNNNNKNNNKKNIFTTFFVCVCVTVCCVRTHLERDKIRFIFLCFRGEYLERRKNFIFNFYFDSLALSLWLFCYYSNTFRSLNIFSRRIYISRLRRRRHRQLRHWHRQHTNCERVIFMSPTACLAGIHCHRIFLFIIIIISQTGLEVPCAQIRFTLHFVVHFLSSSSNVSNVQLER